MQMLTLNRHRSAPTPILIMWLLASGCSSLQSTHEDEQGHPSQLASLTIAAYQPPSDGILWRSMKLMAEQVTPTSLTVDRSFDRAAFESGNVEDRSVKLGYGTYLFRLTYHDEGNQLIYQSCPEDESRQHEITTSKYRLTIKICKTPALGSSQIPVPSGEVAITPTADISIAPIPEDINNHPEQQSFPDPRQEVNGIWVDPNSSAMREALRYRSAASQDGRRLRYIATQPAAIWYAQWRDDIREIVARDATAAQAANATLVIVPYLIPLRDCGQYSAGGVDAERYQVWINRVADGLGNAKVLVILEPDALAMIDDLKDGQPCLTDEEKATRLELMRMATVRFKRNPNARVYLDAGHPGWKSVDFMVDILTRAGIDAADGFALNVSSYQTTQANVAYGAQIIGQLSKKTFVIDTSRNGNGPAPDNEWCNPAGRALGTVPTLQTKFPSVDALLWIKRPGESDGTCNGGPHAGAWWREMALQLAKNAGIP